MVAPGVVRRPPGFHSIPSPGMRTSPNEQALSSYFIWLTTLQSESLESSIIRFSFSRCLQLHHARNILTEQFDSVGKATSSQVVFSLVDFLQHSIEFEIAVVTTKCDMRKEARKHLVSVGAERTKPQQAPNVATKDDEKLTLI